MNLISTSTESFQGCTLLVAGVTIGNSGQLAIDLLIESLQATPIGFFDADTVLPCLGSDAHSHLPGLLTHNLELFRHTSSNLLILQQRSPVAPGLQKQAALDLSSWCQQSGISRVIVLCSLDASVRIDSQLKGSQLRFWSESPNLIDQCHQMGLMQLEEDYFEGDVPMAERLLPPWSVIKACTASGIECAALAIFTTPGDNVGDGESLARVAAKLVLVDNNGVLERLVRPMSWKHVYDAGHRHGEVY